MEFTAQTWRVVRGCRMEVPRLFESRELQCKTRQIQWERLIDLLSRTTVLDTAGSELTDWQPILK
jgi:hypothetical protein